MSSIILDFGSGETCKNDRAIIRDLIDQMHAAVSGSRFIPGSSSDDRVYIKWQLFEWINALRPLTMESFAYAYGYAEALGYQTTASVFDAISLARLQEYDVPFVKIACREWAYPLSAGITGRRVVSVPDEFVDVVPGTGIGAASADDVWLACVPEYPATGAQYADAFAGTAMLAHGISDHTRGLDLYRDHRPAWWEKHYILEGSTGADSEGGFAITPDALAEAVRIDGPQE